MTGIPPELAPLSDRWLLRFSVIRRVIVFGLGIWVIIAALNDPESQNTIAMLVIGAIMVGVLPVGDLLGTLHRATLSFRNGNGKRHAEGPPPGGDGPTRGRAAT